MSKNLIFFMPFIGGGGVEKNLFIIANYFAKKINKIYLCTGSKKYKKKFPSKLKFISPKKNLKPNLNMRFYYLVCLYYLTKFLIKNKNSIVFSFQANVYCILLCKILNIEIIVRSNSSPSGWYHNFIKKFIYKLIINLSDKIIVNSMEFKKQMDNNFNTKTVCIYNPLNFKEIIKKSKKKTFNNFFKNKNSYLKLINMGRFTDQKNQIIILKAINLIKESVNLRLIIMGRGVEQINLRNFINQNKLNKIVRLENFKDNPYPVLNQSDCFILSSKYEGLPNVLLESIVLNKFIISTNCPTGPKEIIQNSSQGIFFKTGDYNQLAKKIIYVSKNLGHIKKLGKKNKYNLKKFSYEKNMKKYFKVVQYFLKS